MFSRFMGYKYDFFTTLLSPLTKSASSSLPECPCHCGAALLLLSQEAAVRRRQGTELRMKEAVKTGSSMPYTWFLLSLSVSGALAFHLLAAIVTRTPASLPVSHLLFICRCIWRGDGEDRSGNLPVKGCGFRKLWRPASMDIFILAGASCWSSINHK